MKYCYTEWSKSFNIFGPEGKIPDLIVSSIRNIIASEDIPLQRNQSNCWMFKQADETQTGNKSHI